MDIIFKLRFLLWIFVLGLWGMLIYGFLRDEATYSTPRLTTIHNPFVKEEVQTVENFPEVQPAKYEDEKASPGPLPSSRLQADLDSAKSPYRFLIPENQTAPSPLPVEPSTGKTTEPAESGRLGSTSLALATPPQRPPAVRRSSSKTLPPEGSGYVQPTEDSEQPAPKSKRAAPKAPPGFEASQTAHFTVYYEGSKAPIDFLIMLENLHSNLMLDLAAFAPWARNEKVTLYLFQAQTAYQKFTGRPAWSGGSSSVEKRIVYLYKSNELVGILAHELCHIYFDSFFTKNRAAPLWLSEGMATFIQIQRGLSAPNWIRPNLVHLVDGKSYAFKELMRAKSLTGVSDSSVRLWYTQSYSVVRFLIRSKWFVSYYQFCKNLRDGQRLPEALYKAYGMPYNRVSALEYAWRYDLKTHELSSLAMGQSTTSE